MPRIHHDVVRKLLPRVQLVALHPVRSVAYESLPVPAGPKLLDSLQLSPVHVACILRPRIVLRVEERPERTIATPCSQPCAHYAISRLRRRPSSAQALFGRTLPPRSVLLPDRAPLFASLRARLAIQLHRLRQWVVRRVPRESPRQLVRLPVRILAVTPLRILTLAPRSLFLRRRRRPFTASLSLCSLSQVPLMSRDHLPLGALQKSPIPLHVLRLQRRQHLPVKRVRSFVLLNDPLGHPLPQHGVGQHLHER